MATQGRRAAGDSVQGKLEEEDEWEGREGRTLMLCMP